MTETPLINIITNGVTREFVCDVLIAGGGSPIMTEYYESFHHFFGAFDNLLVNLGQLHGEKIDSLRKGVKLAEDKELPWVIDLVGYAANPYLKDLTKDLLESKPAVIKGNLAEIKHFLDLPALAQGVDSGEGDLSFEDEQVLKEAAQTYIKDTDLVLFATGHVDYVFSKDRAHALSNGSDYMGKVIGTGDAQGGLLALGACLEGDLVENLIDQTSHFNLASQAAAQAAKEVSSFSTPVGTFKSLLIDALSSNLDWQSQKKVRDL